MLFITFNLVGRSVEVLVEVVEVPVEVKEVLADPEEVQAEREALAEESEANHRRGDAPEIEKEVVLHVNDPEKEVLGVLKIIKDPNLETLKDQDLVTDEVDQKKDEEKKGGVVVGIVNLVLYGKGLLLRKFLYLKGLDRL